MRLFLYKIMEFGSKYGLLLKTLDFSVSQLVVIFGLMTVVGFAVVQQDQLFKTAQDVRIRASESKEAVKVKRVIDGDTIELSDGRVVRYIGIDAPEKGECMYRSAAKANQDLVADKRIVIEKDTSQEDDYGRLLRYVWIDKVLINEKLVAEGFAKSTPVQPDLKYNARILEAHRSARKGRVGLWPICWEQENSE
jgi:endonuclease YncB( thermonuclease family)